MQQEVFSDAFGQTSSNLILPKPQESARASRFSEQMHAVMNVAAVLTIISFVALQRNASLDLAKLFMPACQYLEAFVLSLIHI